MCRCLNQTERKQVWGKIITWHLSALHLISEGYLQKPWWNCFSGPRWKVRRGENPWFDFVLWSYLFSSPPPHPTIELRLPKSFQVWKDSCFGKTKHWLLQMSMKMLSISHHLPEGVDIIIASFRRLTCQNARITLELGDFDHHQSKACV